MDKKLLLLVFIASSLVLFVDSAKIVFLLSSATPSHKIVHYPIAGELARRGHDVTMISIFKPKGHVPPGVKEIVLEEIGPIFRSFIPQMFDENGIMDGWRVVYSIEYHSIDTCYHWLRHPKLQQILKNEKYDLAVVNGMFSECLVPVGRHLADKLVYLLPGELHNTLAWSLNIPFPNYVPVVYFTPNTIHMNFFERLNNAWNGLLWMAFRELIIIPRTDKIIKEVLPNAMSIKDAEDEMDLVLVNRHHVIDYVAPTIPFVQEIGGITASPSKPLPKDFLDFVNSSGDAGFIIVSLGTLVPDHTMPEFLRNIFVDAFAKIPQKVIWKFGAPLDKIPPNVKIVSWMPQNDLLGHPKAKAFITHGGHFGLVESVYHGVPMVGLPVFADQAANVNRIQQKDLGIALQWNNLTSSIVASAVRNVIEDPKYKTSVLHHRDLMNDEPMPVLDRTAFWIEHVLRHGGKAHLRAEGADRLNSLQYFMLDIVGFVAAVALIFFYVTYKLITCICCRRSKIYDKLKRN